MLTQCEHDCILIAQRALVSVAPCFHLLDDAVQSLISIWATKLHTAKKYGEQKLGKRMVAHDDSRHAQLERWHESRLTLCSRTGCELTVAAHQWAEDTRGDA